MLQCLLVVLSMTMMPMRSCRVLMCLVVLSMMMMPMRSCRGLVGWLVYSSDSSTPSGCSCSVMWRRVVGQCLALTSMAMLSILLLLLLLLPIVGLLLASRMLAESSPQVAYPAQKVASHPSRAAQVVRQGFAVASLPGASQLSWIRR